MSHFCISWPKKWLGFWSFHKAVADRQQFKLEFFAWQLSTYTKAPRTSKQLSNLRMAMRVKMNMCLALSLECDQRKVSALTHQPHKHTSHTHRENKKRECTSQKQLQLHGKQLNSQEISISQTECDEFGIHGMVRSHLQVLVAVSFEFERHVTSR